MYCTMHEVPRTPCWSQKDSVSHSAADESALEVYNQRFVHGIRAQDHQAGGEQAGRRGDKRALMTGGDKWVKLCHSASPDTSGVDGTSCRNPGGWRTFSFCRKNRKQIWYYTVLVNSVVIWGGKKTWKTCWVEWKKVKKLQCLVFPDSWQPEARVTLFAQFSIVRLRQKSHKNTSLVVNLNQIWSFRTSMCSQYWWLDKISWK